MLKYTKRSKAGMLAFLQAGRAFQFLLLIMVEEGDPSPIRLIGSGT